jgi:hypothetical protein
VLPASACRVSWTCERCFITASSTATVSVLTRDPNAWSLGLNYSVQTTSYDGKPSLVVGNVFAEPGELVNLHTRLRSQAQPLKSLGCRRRPVFQGLSQPFCAGDCHIGTVSLLSGRPKRRSRHQVQFDQPRKPAGSGESSHSHVHRWC